MPKMKSHRGARKRFKLTGTGKVKRFKAFKSHILTKKSFKRKKQIMKAARGAFGARSKLWKAAKENVERGWKYAYRDRKNKKRDFRKLWIVRINAGAHQHGMSYSVFMHGLKKAGIEIDRKVLSDITVNDAEAFTALAEKARSALDAA